jgi:mannose-6-phosphate isomerase-like protein (cupin superfamily)
MTTETVPFIVRPDEAKVFYEGPELCREYFRNDMLWFGSSLVNPGETGAIDPGHDGAWEVFYVVSGEGVMDDGEKEYSLSAGDTLAFPPNVPHRIHNRGTDPVLMVWAGGPSTPGTSTTES